VGEVKWSLASHRDKEDGRVKPRKRKGAKGGTPGPGIKRGVVTMEKAGEKLSL